MAWLSPLVLPVKEEAMTDTRRNHILATADPGFIELSVDVPYRTCSGCSHYRRIRFEAPEWLLSENCPCMECSSNYLLGYADRLEHWTRGRIGTFTEGEWFDPARGEGRTDPQRQVDVIDEYERGVWGLVRFDPVGLL